MSTRFFIYIYIGRSEEGAEEEGEEESDWSNKAAIARPQPEAIVLMGC